MDHLLGYTHLAFYINLSLDKPYTLNTTFFSLNHELIDLMSRDYCDFIKLSTTLVDVDVDVVRMGAPLLELIEKIDQLIKIVEGSLVASKNVLKQRFEATAARKLLELLLDTFHVVSKVDKQIKVLPCVQANSSDGDANLIEKNSMSYGTSLQHVENGTNFRDSKHVF